MKTKNISRVLCLLLALVMGAVLLSVPALAKDEGVLKEEKGGEAYYAVQVASTTSLKSAQTTAERFGEEGYEPYIYQSAGSSRFKLMLGAFEDKADAEALREELQEYDEIAGVKLSSAAVVEVKLTAESTAGIGSGTVKCIPGVEWSGIKEIITYGNWAIGLRADGTLALAGDMDEALKEKLSGWKDVQKLEWLTSLRGYEYALAGYTSSGGVRIIPWDGNWDGNQIPEELTASWKDVKKICDVGFGDELYCIGLSSNGTVLTAYEGSSPEREELLHTIQGWKNIKDLIVFEDDERHVITENGEKKLEINWGSKKLYALGLKSDGTVVCSDAEYYDAMRTSVDSYTGERLFEKQEKWINVREIGFVSAYEIGFPYAICNDGALLGFSGDYVLSDYDEETQEYITCDAKELRMKTKFYPWGFSEFYGITTDGRRVVHYECYGFSFYGDDLKNAARFAHDGGQDRPQEIWWNAYVRTDGTVSVFEDNSDWTDIRELYNISCPGGEWIGLRNDGTVITDSEDEAFVSEIAEWTGIKAVYRSGDFLIGLRKDGTVVTYGDNELG